MHRAPVHSFTHVSGAQHAHAEAGGRLGGAAAAAPALGPCTRQRPRQCNKHLCTAARAAALSTTAAPTQAEAVQVSQGEQPPQHVRDAQSDQLQSPASSSEESFDSETPQQALHEVVRMPAADAEMLAIEVHEWVTQPSDKQAQQRASSKWQNCQQERAKRKTLLALPCVTVRSLQRLVSTLSHSILIKDPEVVEAVKVEFTRRVDDLAADQLGRMLIAFAQARKRVVLSGDAQSAAVRALVAQAEHVSANLVPSVMRAASVTLAEPVDAAHAVDVLARLCWGTMQSLKGALGVIFATAAMQDQQAHQLHAAALRKIQGHMPEMRVTCKHGTLIFWTPEREHTTRNVRDAYEICQQHIVELCYRKRDRRLSAAATGLAAMDLKGPYDVDKRRLQATLTALSPDLAPNEIADAWQIVREVLFLRTERSSKLKLALFAASAAAAPDMTAHDVSRMLRSMSVIESWRMEQQYDENALRQHCVQIYNVCSSLYSDLSSEQFADVASGLCELSKVYAPGSGAFALPSEQRVQQQVRFSSAMVRTMPQVNASQLADVLRSVRMQRMFVSQQAQDAAVAAAQRCIESMHAPSKESQQSLVDIITCLAELVHPSACAAALEAGFAKVIDSYLSRRQKGGVLHAAAVIKARGYTPWSRSLSSFVLRSKLTGSDMPQKISLQAHLLSLVCTNTDVNAIQHVCSCLTSAATYVCSGHALMPPRSKSLAGSRGVVHPGFGCF